jgi:hypothetical protein
MADAYYYQDVNAQIIGPLAPAALKKLANEGVVVETTLVRKGEQGAWYQAGTIAGLVPPRPAEPEASNTSAPDPKQRVKETFRKAEEQADKVAATLWFLDLKFNQFFTPKLIGAVWALYLCLIILVFLGSCIHSLLTMYLPFALFTILVEFVGLMFAMIFTRVLLELFLVMFRVAEHLENLKYLENLKHLDNLGNPPAGL